MSKHDAITREYAAFVSPELRGPCDTIPDMVFDYTELAELVDEDPASTVVEPLRIWPLREFQQMLGGDNE